MLLILISILLITCKSEKSKNEKDVVQDTRQVILDSVLSYDLYINSEACVGWHKSKINIINKIKEFEEISSYEWHQCYGSYECGVKGELIFSNLLYKYHLNAGGWLHLIGEKEEKFLGTKDKKDTLNFLSIYFCDEMWD